MKKNSIGIAVLCLAAVCLLSVCELSEVTDAVKGKEAVTRIDAAGGTEIEVALDVDNGSRALDADLAKNAINYYEVVFWKNDVGQEAYVAGYKGQTFKVKIPQLDYDGSTTAGKGRAVVFAGRASDKVLLAIGELTQVDNGSGLVNGKVVGTNTKAVKFTLSALSSTLTDDETTSTFLTASTASTGGTAIANTPFLFFDVTNGGTENATFKPALTGITTADLVVFNKTTMQVDYLPTEVGYESVVLPSVDRSLGSLGDPMDFASGVTFLVSANISAATPPNPQTGMTMLAFSIPVAAIQKIDSSSADSASNRKDGIEWYIRPGLTTFQPDDKKNNGGILLRVGSAAPVDPNGPIQQGITFGL